MPKSIILKKNGGPEVLELQDVKVGSPGPDEIKVTNHAIGLNYIDTYHRSGLYPIKLPSGIGLEAAGKIDEVGSNVTEFNKGDNVAYASVPLGAYAQQRIIPAKIAANKIKGIRAANVVDELTAIQSVEHNNVNVLCLGSNNVSNENALSIVLKFLNTYMLEEERYSRRVGKLEN